MEKKPTIFIFQVSFAWLLGMIPKAKYLKYPESYGDLRAQKFGVQTARRPWRHHSKILFWIIFMKGISLLNERGY